MDRFLGIALAVVMTGTPVLTTMCQAACAARESTSAAIPEHHSCHHQAPSPEGPVIDGSAHACGHSDEAPTAIDQAFQNIAAAPAVTVAIFSVMPSSVEARPLRSAYFEHSPPGLLALQTELRI